MHWGGVPMLQDKILSLALFMFMISTLCLQPLCYTTPGTTIKKNNKYTFVFVNKTKLKLRWILLTHCRDQVTKGHIIGDLVGVRMKRGGVSEEVDPLHASDTGRCHDSSVATLFLQDTFENLGVKTLNTRNNLRERARERERERLSQMYKATHDCNYYTELMYVPSSSLTHTHVHVHAAELVTIVMRVRTLWMILCEWMNGWSVCRIITPTKLLKR